MSGKGKGIATEFLAQATFRKTADEYERACRSGKMARGPQDDGGDRPFQQGLPVQTDSEGCERDLSPVSDPDAIRMRRRERARPAWTYRLNLARSLP